MAEGELYKRRWRVTFARLGIALAVIAGFSAWFAAASVAVDVARQDPSPHAFRATALIFAWSGVTWLIPFGLLADHALAEFGPWPALGVHVVGVYVSGFAQLILGGPAAAHFGPTPGEPFATLALATPVIVALVAFVAAWIMPGSFSTREQRAADRDAILADLAAREAARTASTAQPPAATGQA